MINAAMKTTPPAEPKPYFYKGAFNTVTAKRPTSLMVHIAGHGARRVYRSDYTGRYYITIDRQKVPVDPIEIAALCGR